MNTTSKDNVDDPKAMEQEPTESPSVPQNFRIQAITDYLASSLWVQALYGGAGGFFLYFSMYALRKPFKAAKFVDEETGEKLMFFGSNMTLKTAIVLFQLIGYMSSKWIGIKVVSEAKGKQDIYLAILAIVAELALVLYGILGQAKDPSWTPFPMLINGLMLGMVWGLTVAYFEGRTTSDFSLVCLSISFIVSSGIVKDVALVVLDWGVDQFWMPSVVGLLFFPLYFFCILMLNQLPPPTKLEELDKANRIVMTHQSRLDYFLKFWPGLLALWIGVMFLTAYRDYRDTFAVEIFEDLGYESEPGNLSKSESLVAGILLIPIAALVFCKNNLLAFQLSMLSLMLGSVLLLLSVYIFLGSEYSGFSYYVLTGVASYLAYVPYNSVLYERLIAVLHEPCNIAYLMAVMDALGYLGVFVLYFVAEFGDFDGHLDAYNKVGQVFGFVTLAVYIGACVYFFIFKRDILFVRDGKQAAGDHDQNAEATKVYDEKVEPPTQSELNPSEQAEELEYEA